MGNKGEVITKNICRFSSNLKETKMFTYKPKDGEEGLNYISKICHYSGDKFIVGHGRYCSLCRLDTASLYFREISRFELPDDELLSRTGINNEKGRAGQGIYYANPYIYNIFSYKRTNESYKFNDIAVYSVREVNDQLTATLVNIYRCDNNMDLFEIEGIAKADNSFYINMNHRLSEDNPRDGIFKIAFINDLNLIS